MARVLATLAMLAAAGMAIESLMTRDWTLWTAVWHMLGAGVGSESPPAPRAVEPAKWSRRQLVITTAAPVAESEGPQNERLKPGTLRSFTADVFTPKVRITGSDIAGRVEAVGGGVKTFPPGDEVYGDLCMSGFGAFAEYACEPGRA